MSATRVNTVFTRTAPIALFLVIATLCHAQTGGVPAVAEEIPRKLQKHFDRDGDGYLDQIERMNLRTHQIFHYPLAEKRKHEPYDVNGDLMLEPFEMRQYLADKVAGRLNEVYKEYEKRKTLAERQRKRRLKAVERFNSSLENSE